jgi:hypothetical protein
MGATEATYGLILERLKLMAVNKELTMEVKTFSEMRDLQDQAQGDGDGGGGGSSTSQGRSRKRTAGKVNSVSTDYRPASSVSSMTMNTAASAARADRFPLCQTCRLFHNTDKKGKDGKPVCLFWDPVARTFKVKAFLEHRHVIVMTRKEEKALSEYWMKKLEQYAFPAMNITAAECYHRGNQELRRGVEAVRGDGGARRQELHQDPPQGGERPGESGHHADGEDRSSEDPPEGQEESVQQGGQGRVRVRVLLGV